MVSAQTPNSARALADELVNRLLQADPLLGTSLGMREYDALVPDVSVEAEQRLSADLAAIAERATSLDPDSAAARATLAAVHGALERTRLAIAIAELDYTASAMPMHGAPALFALAARTTLTDVPAAADYLARLRAAPAWLDQTTERLRAGQARGLSPVASLVDQSIEWAERTLAAGLPYALVAPVPPAGWPGADRWRAEVADAITGGVLPAVGRWRDLLAELRTDARGDDAVGLAALPGGAERYLDCIRLHTTLELSADELHEIGLQRIAELQEQALGLGAGIGLVDLAAIMAAVRGSAAHLDAEAAIAAARAAIARAEARAGEMMPAPLPAACAVTPMPTTVAESGMAPHYTRPRLDGSRPGTFWFNTDRPTAGTGWDLEAVAFHEAVPGHHSQLARLQRLTDLPLLQQLSVTAHAEGWGLYAERLAGEFSLYSGARAELGAVYIEMHRAARLVVDTGMHARGWSRSEAVRFMVEHVALPVGFLENEIDRYIAWPGQALAYLTGQRELLRLRAHAESELGERFELPGFHAAVLDSGALPLPALAAAVDDLDRLPRSLSARGSVDLTDTRNDCLTDLGELAELVRVEPLDDVSAHRGDVSRGGCLEHREAGAGELGELPTPVGVAVAPGYPTALLETGDGMGEPAARRAGSRSQFAHAHRARGRLRQAHEYLVVGVRDAGIALQLAVQHVEEHDCRLEVRAPGALLLGAEPLRFRHPTIICSRPR